MKAFLKKFLGRAVPGITLNCRAYRNLIRNSDSYLHSTGWMRSLQEWKPQDKNGNPLPWMNYPVISFLDERLNKNLSLFEFGSGYSTLFFAERVKNVTSVEYDETWHHRMKDNLPGNAGLILKEADIDGEYCRTAATKGNNFDVLVVDGRDRVNCIKQSLPVLSPSGIVILDDSQRKEYREGIEFLLDRGFRALHFEGLKPTGFGTVRTTVFYRDGNCFGI